MSFLAKVELKKQLQEMGIKVVGEHVHKAEIHMFLAKRIQATLEANEIKKLEEFAEDVSSDMISDDKAWDTFINQSVKQKILFAFLHGECDAFAVALYRIFGWKLINVVTENGSVHRISKTSDGRLVDASGYVTKEQLQKRYRAKKCSFSKEGDESMALGLVEEYVPLAASAMLLLDIPPFSLNIKKIKNFLIDYDFDG